MDTSSKISRRTSKTLIAGTLALALALSGCSGEESGSGETPQPSTSAGQTAAAPEETTEETTTEAPATPEETTSGPSASPTPEAEEASSGGTTALSGGLDAARSEAESWNEDAELYAIASLRPTVNAEGENEGWLYSFVSESQNAVVSLPYSDGEVRATQGQELPEEQIELIASDTLPVGDLIDSPEAIQQSEDVQSYLQENPEAGVSASVDSASNEEPEWILIVPQEGLQDRVPAVE